MKSNSALPCGVSSPRPDRQRRAHVAGDEALEELGHVLGGVFASDTQHGARQQAGSGHPAQMGHFAAKRNQRPSCEYCISMYQTW